MNMRLTIFLALSLMLSFFSCQNVDSDKNSLNQNTVSKTQTLELELNKDGVKQFEIEGDVRFDLSGIVQVGEKVFVVADKVWNKSIYQIDTLKNKIKIVDERKICVYEDIDFEGIEAFHNGFFIINERLSQVYSIDFDNCFIKILPIDWSKLKLDISEWNNKGLEGVAFDPEHEILYLLKEREPRNIYAFNLKTNELYEPFTKLFNTQTDDFTDAKIEDGKLYLLERNESQIFRIDLKTNALDSVSFKNIFNPNKQRLYETENPEYGTAESLLLTKNEIWVGIDNNGEKTSIYGQKLGLDKTNRPVLVVFKRPENF